MYKNILIGTDGSPLGDKAVDHGLALAKSMQAKVTIVTVTQHWSTLDLALEASKDRHNPNPLKQFEEMAADAAKHILNAATAKAKAANVPFEVRHVPNKYAGEGVIETADAIQADLVVMASHGRRGINRLLLGSQAYEVVSRSKVPVLIVR
jgi:nucleotide-binding universal stress UspA family protein